MQSASDPDMESTIHGPYTGLGQFRVSQLQLASPARVEGGQFQSVDKPKRADCGNRARATSMFSICVDKTKQSDYFSSQCFAVNFSRSLLTQYRTNTSTRRIHRNQLSSLESCILAHVLMPAATGTAANVMQRVQPIWVGGSCLFFQANNNTT